MSKSDQRKFWLHFERRYFKRNFLNTLKRIYCVMPWNSLQA